MNKNRNLGKRPGRARLHKLPLITITLLVFVVSPFISSRTHAAFLAGLGHAPGYLSSSSFAMSRDGRTVVGSGAIYGGSEAFRWTVTDGMQNLGDLSGGTTFGVALGVAPDGSVVVGYGYTDAGQQGFRWDAVSGLRAYGSPGYVHAVYGLFDETTHEFGVLEPLSSTSPYRGFVNFSDSFFSQNYPDLLPYALSGNKLYFAGAGNRYEYGSGPYCTGPYYVYSPVRFTFDGQAVTVAGPEGAATGISSDGTVVVGNANNSCQPYNFEPSVPRAFRWVEGQGTQYLGTLPVPGWIGPPDPGSTASGVSADGATVVGRSDSSNGPRAYIWDPSNGMRDLADVLGGLGVAFPGWTLSTAAGISADGLTVTGTGTNPSGKSEAWIANLSPTSVAELAVTLTDNPDPLPLGQTLTYIAKVTNYGNSMANDVVLSGTTPLSVTSVSVSATQGSCSITEQITCSLGSIAPGGSAEVTLSVVPNSGGTITYAVSLASSSSDAITANNNATASTTVEESAADIMVSIADSPDPVPAGHNVSYTATITNNGARSATNVTFTSATPVNTTHVSSSTSQGSCSGYSSITCSLGSLDPGASATVSLAVNTSSTFSGIISRTAIVRSQTIDSNPANNTATVETTVEATADISVAVSVPSLVLNGESFSYIVTVRNYGLATASDVVFTSPTPGNITPVSASASQGSCGGSSTVTCNLGTIAGGATVTVSIDVIASMPYSLNGAITYRNLSATTTSIEATTINNSLYAIVNIGSVFDLAFSIDDQPDPIVAGQPLTYTVLVTNNGPHHAGTVGFRMRADSSLTRVSSSPSQGNCSLISNENSWGCGLGSAGLAAGATAKVVFVVTPNTTGSVTSTVNLTSTGVSYDPDPIAENDTANATTTVIVPSADLALTLSDSPDPVVIGQPLAYTATIVNNGPIVGTNTRFTSTTPPGVSHVSVSASQGNCSGGSDVLCDLGELGAGAAATITMIVTPQAAGMVTRSASAGSDVTDIVPGNNVAVAETIVQAGADLSLLLIDNPDPVKKGAKLTYTLNLKNNGPLSASDAALTIQLPGPIVFEGLATSRGSCVGTGPVTCQLGTLLNGEEVDIKVVIKPMSVGTASANTNVTAGTPDPNQANNTASTSTTVFK